MTDAWDSLAIELVFAETGSVTEGVGLLLVLVGLSCDIKIMTDVSACSSSICGMCKVNYTCMNQL